MMEVNGMNIQAEDNLIIFSFKAFGLSDKARWASVEEKLKSMSTLLLGREYQATIIKVDQTTWVYKYIVKTD